MLKALQEFLRENENARQTIALLAGIATLIVTVSGFLQDELRLEEDHVLAFAYFCTFIAIMGASYWTLGRRAQATGARDRAEKHPVLENQLLEQKHQLGLYIPMVRNLNALLDEERAKYNQQCIVNTSLTIEHDLLLNAVHHAYKEETSDAIKKILEPFVPVPDGTYTGNGNNLTRTG